MVPRLLVADRTGERIATVEDEVDLPMRRWLRIRNVADLSVVVTAPLCLAGAPEGRVAVPCDIQAAPGNVRAAAFAPDGSAIAIACVGCAYAAATPGAPELPSLHVLDARAGTLRFAVGLGMDPYRLAWGTAGIVISGHDTSTGPAFAVVDARTGEEIRVTALDESIVGFSPDATAYVTGATRQVRLLEGGSGWSAGSSNDAVLLFEGGGAVAMSSISATRFDPGGREHGRAPLLGTSDIAAVAPDGSHALGIETETDAPSIVRLVSFDGGRLPFEARVEGTLDGAVVLRDGTVLVTGGEAGLRRIVGEPKVHGLALSPDRTTLVAAEAEGTSASPRWSLRVRDAVTLEPRMSVPAGPIAQLVVDPDGGRVAVALAELPPDVGTIELRSLATGAIERTISVPFDVRALAWGRDRIAVAGARAVASVDPATGVLTSVAMPPDASLESLAPDASAIAIRFQGGPYHEPMGDGGHATVIPPARIERLQLGDGTRTVLLDETRAGVVALADGAWLEVDDAAITRHDASGGVVARIARAGAGAVEAATSDGAHVLQIDGSYALTVRALDHEGAEVTERLRSQALAFALGPDGTTYVGLPGGGVVRRTVTPAAGP